jgi:uncharacterized protein (TIRG00374 family)
LRRLQGGAAGLFALAAGIAPARWAALLALAVAFWALDGARFAAPLRLLGHRVSVLECVQLGWVSYFVASLTPVAELHVPAMVWLLGRQGVPAGNAAAATAVKSLVFTVWICVGGLCALLLGGARIADPSLARALWLGSLLLIPGVALFAVLVAFPLGVQRWVAPRVERASGVVRALLAGAAQGAQAVAKMGRSTDPRRLLMHAASLGGLFVYGALGFAACAALDVPLSLPRALAAFTLGLMVVYLAPLPGSIGVAELSQAWLIDPALPPRAVAAAAVVRVLCWYGPALAGAAILSLRAAGRRRDEPASTR